MSTQNRWVKKSEREPTPEDLPVWLSASNRKGVCLVYNTICSEYISEHTTHWCSAAADIPAPPREKTQLERDDEAHDAWWKTVDRLGTRHAWHAALAYERAEVGKMLPSSEPATYNAHYATEVIKAIRARCGGGK